MNEQEALEELIRGWTALGVEVDAYLDSNRRMIKLARLVVPKEQRKEGIGSKVMEDLTALADEFGLTIALSPSTDFGATSVDRLRRFYGRFGFVRNRGRHKDYQIFESMYRPPR